MHGGGFPRSRTGSSIRALFVESGCITTGPTAIHDGLTTKNRGNRPRVPADAGWPVLKSDHDARICNGQLTRRQARSFIFFPFALSTLVKDSLLGVFDPLFQVGRLAGLEHDLALLDQPLPPEVEQAVVEQDHAVLPV